MSFASVQFLYVFLPLSLAAYYLLPRPLRNLVLAVFSLVFCVWGGLRHTLLLVGFTLLNWLFGLVLGRRPGRTPLLWGAVGVDLLYLCFFKYAGFFAENLNLVLPVQLPVLELALPLGISFYTFQAISYCIDVARGQAAPQRNPVRFFCYLAFFGHISSGPIVRYLYQAEALDPCSPARRVGVERFCYGIKRFVFGLAKKALIADQLGLLYSRVISLPAAELPGEALALGYLAFALELYYDFSGYSDMAVGLGEMFGLVLPENFDYPYLSSTVGEFWRRWHITLGGWFRDYLYFPLGGSRVGLLRTCRNLLVVFLLTGLWHGAAWQYLAFGLWHGVLLCLERLGLKRLLDHLPRLFSHIYTCGAVWIGMVFFGAPGLREGLRALYGIARWQSGAPGLTFSAFADPKLLVLLVVGLLFCGPVQAAVPGLRQALRSRDLPGPAMMLVLLVLGLFSLMRVTAGTYNAFIYFQF